MDHLRMRGSFLLSTIFFASVFYAAVILTGCAAHDQGSMRSEAIVDSEVQNPAPSGRVPKSAPGQPQEGFEQQPAGTR